MTRRIDGAVDLAHAMSERLRGWRDVLEPAGIEPQIVPCDHNTLDEAATAAAAFLDTATPPTAVLCYSDVIALGVVMAARPRGLELPGHLSVVGFDDSPLASRVEPALTTVRQDVVAKGHAAAAALTSAIEHARSGTRGRARHVKLPTELVVRASTARPVDE
jgi:DNA-binding LacI/PurR family transcriptional regulator